LSKREEPEIPTITLDQDQVKIARETVAKSAQPKTTTSASKVNKSSLLPVKLLLLMPYLALAGSAWYFYQQQSALDHQLNSSVERIQQLENQLSATGEEMGESTIALKIKLEAISEKTELLISEMDKLWASAWRRNQQEIKALNSQSIKQTQQQDKNTSSISQQNAALNDLQDKITATEFSINAATEQLLVVGSLKDELKKLASQLNTLDANAKSRDKQQMFTATTVNEFDTSLQLLIERVERIEVRLRNQGG